MSEIWKNAVAVWKKQFIGKDHCDICGFPLERVFPKDYPKEWKFCCSCILWAKSIIDEEPFVNMEMIEKSLVLKKIFDRVTLVK